jgi:O-antigen ligase
MSSTAIPRRTDHSVFLTPDRLSQLRTLAAGLILTVLLVSFRPFQLNGSADPNQSGDILNQLGFSAVGAVSLLLMLSLVDRRILISLISPWWSLVFCFVTLSVLNSLNPFGAFRAVMFMMMGVFGIMAVLSLTPSADGFSKILAVAASTVLLLSFAGVILMPEIARHGADSVEPEHVGLWRGIFSHKNVAGPVMASISFAGLYLFRRGWRFVGLILGIGALIFLSNTGSKTSALLSPMVVLIVLLPGVFGARALASVSVFFAMCLFALGTLGTVLFRPLEQLRDYLSPGTTYTGRTEIWKYAFSNIADRPWTGFGFEGFWLSPFVRGGEKDISLAWDVRGAVHGHNGYVDIALAMGVPALCAALLALVIVPLADYARVQKTRENVFIADLFLMIFTFSALNAFLESFFFRRADPVWLLFLMAVLGLRLVSRFEVRK